MIRPFWVAQSGFTTAPAGISPTVGLVSHPHPGKLDHCRAQTWIACLRDTLLVVDATTFPWAGSQACIGCQLPSVLEMPEQTLKVEHGSELRANALEPHK